MMERFKWRRSSYRLSAKLVGILVLCMAILSGCSVTDMFKSDKNAEKPVGKPVKQQYNVEVTRIAKKQIAEPPEVSAVLTPSVAMSISIKTGGIVEQIVKKRGDAVKAGDILLKLNSSDARYEKEKAALGVQSALNAIALARTAKKNDLARAQQKLESQTKSYNTLKNDYDEGLATKAQLDQAETLLADAKAALTMLQQSNRTADLELQLRNAQISLQEANQALAGLEVKAPISGIVTELTAEQGMTLSGNAKIGLIENVDPIHMTAMIPSENAKTMKGKKELTYYVPDTQIQGRGKIIYVSDAEDPKTGLYELILEVPNKESLLKQSMDVKLQLEDQQNLMVVTVPSYSILRNGSDAYVFVLVNDVAEKRSVKLGRLSEPNQEVTSGVKEGEMVVVSGQNDLKDGQKIQLATVQTSQK